MYILQNQCHTFDEDHVGLKKYTKGGNHWNGSFILNKNIYSVLIYCCLFILLAHSLYLKVY